LDAHAAKVVACAVDAESGEMTVHRLPGETAAVVAFCAGLPTPVRAAYEAGSTGYGLARALAAAAVGCVVAAPGEIERRAQDRVNTRNPPGPHAREHPRSNYEQPLARRRRHST
jgi:transposase